VVDSPRECASFPIHGVAFSHRPASLYQFVVDSPTAALLSNQLWGKICCRKSKFNKVAEQLLGKSSDSVKNQQ
jgi:hypothetical protein